MSRERLPGEGIVGAPADPEHCVAAAQHVARFPETAFTPAYLDLARRGMEILKAAQEPA